MDAGAPDTKKRCFSFLLSRSNHFTVGFVGEGFTLFMGVESQPYTALENNGIARGGEGKNQPISEKCRGRWFPKPQRIQCHTPKNQTDDVTLTVVVPLELSLSGKVGFFSSSGLPDSNLTYLSRSQSVFSLRIAWRARASERTSGSVMDLAQKQHSSVPRLFWRARFPGLIEMNRLSHCGSVGNTRTRWIACALQGEVVEGLHRTELMRYSRDFQAQIKFTMDSKIISMVAIF